MSRVHISRFYFIVRDAINSGSKMCPIFRFICALLLLGNDRLAHFKGIILLTFVEWPVKQYLVNNRPGGQYNMLFLLFRFELTAVISSIGNTLANSVWEGRIQNKTKPTPSSPR